MNVFTGMTVNGVEIEASLWKRQKEALNIICKDYYNHNKKLECFVEKNRLIWNTDDEFNLRHQRIFAEELMYAYDRFLDQQIMH